MFILICWLRSDSSHDTWPTERKAFPSVFVCFFLVYILNIIDRGKLIRTKICGHIAIDFQRCWEESHRSIANLAAQSAIRYHAGRPSLGLKQNDYQLLLLHFCPTNHEWSFCIQTKVQIVYHSHCVSYFLITTVSFKRMLYKYTGHVGLTLIFTRNARKNRVFSPSFYT